MDLRSGLALGRNGRCVGIWVAWWAEAMDAAPVGHEVVQLLGTPIEIQHPASPRLDGTPSSPVNAKLDDVWLEQLIMGDLE